MHWGFPYSFLLLAGVIPIILVLHSLRPKGKKVRTTALFLLERVLKERPLGSRVGWLFRKNLLLLLQILAACLLVTALADPFLLFWRANGGDRVVVFDLSASMKAGDRSGTRFDRGRDELLSLIDGLSSGQRMMIIGAGPAAQILSPLTADKRRLREVARSLRPTDAPAQVKEAILLAHSFLRTNSRDQVVAISDGAFGGAEDLPWGSSQLRLIAVAGGKDNVGIMGFEARRLALGADRFEIFLSVQNFTEREIATHLTVWMGEEVWVKDQLNLSPQERKTLIYPYTGPLKRTASAFLDVEDDFPTDNRAFLALSEFPKINLLYVGKGNPFLDHLVDAFPQVHVTSVEQLPPEPFAAPNRDYDLVIFDGVATPPLVEGNFVLINTIGKGLPFKAEGKVTRPLAAPLLTGHPLTKGMRLDNLYIKEALSLTGVGGSTILLGSKQTPLIVALESQRVKALVIGFDLLDSDLPYKIAFPVLFDNVLQWFQPKRPEFPAVQVAAGSPYRIQLKGDEKRVEVTGPGHQRTVLAAEANPLLFADTFDTGFYSYKAGAREGQFAVNLFDEGESDIRPRVTARSTAQAEGESASKEIGKHEGHLWSYLVAVALALLGLEGFLAARAALSPYALAGRLLALSAMILAFSNPRIHKAVTALDVVVAVDQSLSVGQEARQVAVQVLEQIKRLVPSQGRIGLISFARQPVWEFSPRADFPLAEPAPISNREATNLQAALEASLGQMGEGSQGRVLLVSDGNENRGDVTRLVPLLRSLGVQVWTLPVDLAQGRNEILLTDLVLPREVDNAQTFDARAAVQSMRNARARMKLLRDGALLSEREVTLAQGKNWFRMEQNLRSAGVHTFEIAIESAEDTFPENNVLQGIVKVKGPPRVLYLHAREETQRFLARALSVQGYSVVQAAANQVALSLPQLSAFDLVVLDNVPASQLAHKGMEELEKYVRDLGGGLIVIGGSQSFGAGGYLKTPLERVVPLEMRPPSQIDLPHVALLFVLDKSGSMGGGEQGVSKLDLAKSAALAAADLLNPHDQIGILAFDAAWEWLLPFRPVGKGEWISDRLASVQSDGGTDMYKALVEAQRSLEGKSAPIRHVLVLSDGLTDKMDFASLVGKMAAGGITVSTVSLGKDADVSLMAFIARVGKGRAYVTLDQSSVPQIFTTETLLAARDLIVEKPVRPSVLQNTGPFQGIPVDQVPAVRGYVLTYPKAHADLLMKVGEDPLLASWRYGLGRVVAFTSDLSGKWGRDWVQWAEFPRWAAQLARSVRTKTADTRVKIEIQQEEDEAKSVVDVFATGGGFGNHLSLKGAVTGNDQPTQEKIMRQIAPGRYEAHFSGLKRGIHILTVYEAGAGSEPSVALNVPFVSSYSKEYQELQPNTSLLSRLAEGTAGEMLNPAKLEEGVKRLLTPAPKAAQAARETWWPLSGLSLLLFLGDLALRRWPVRT
jgi:Ca-activated chloride channel homolog